MRRLAAALLTLLTFVSPVAAYDLTFDGVAGSRSAGKEFTANFTTTTIANLSASATFVAKPSATYFIKLKHYEDRGPSLPPYREYCYTPILRASGTVTITCSVADAPPGDWFVEVAVSSGRVSVAVVVTID